MREGVYDWTSTKKFHSERKIRLDINGEGSVIIWHKGADKVINTMKITKDTIQRALPVSD